MSQPFLALQGITKQFGSFTAPLAVMLSVVLLPVSMLKLRVGAETWVSTVMSLLLEATPETLPAKLVWRILTTPAA